MIYDCRTLQHAFYQVKKHAGADGLWLSNPETTHRGGAKTPKRCSELCRKLHQALVASWLTTKRLSYRHHGI